MGKCIHKTYFVLLIVLSPQLRSDNNRPIFNCWQKKKKKKKKNGNLYVEAKL